MGKRDNIDPKLQELWDKGVDVYSITRLDCINHCLAEAKFNYIDHLPSAGNIYSELGGNLHETLEGITNGTATVSDLLPNFHKALKHEEMFDITFPKDRNGEDTIKNNYITNIEHFATTYTTNWIGNKPTTAEQFILYQTPQGRNYCQGYIDLMVTQPDGSIDIYDYKSSSRYSKTDMAEHQRQLILYALGKEQEGYKVNSVSWIFLKYARIKTWWYKSNWSKSKSEIYKIVERRNIGTAIADAVESLMKEKGYSEQKTFNTVTKVMESNDIKCLPDDIKPYFAIDIDIESPELSDNTRKECIDYIDNTVKLWQNTKSYPPRDFYRINKAGKKSEDVFYCNSLCDYRDKCPYIKDHNIEMIREKGEFKADKTVSDKSGVRRDLFA